MKFTLSWLKEHLETNASVAEIAERLTDLGLEVESVEDAAAALAPFHVAEIVSAEPHPNADKLRVCVVDTGTEKIQVVCGAPNARAGLKGVLARPGTTIPATGVTLGQAKIRGVESQGMMCSARELNLGEDHAGIIELPADAKLGAPAAEALGLDDPVIDIAITPNRGDCLAVYGVARDLAAAGVGKLKPAQIAPVKGKFASPIAVGTDDTQACPIFAGRVIRGVKNGPSPAWLQNRLKAIGLRPINALVDITNYISVDRARPLHVYDAAKIHGRIFARLARDGEKLSALDGKEYELTREMCVIADDRGVLGLGGVMGGAPSGSALETTDVFIESATFDPIRTARTGRATGILSDARYRFERGVDPAFVLPGLELATRMILELCGGEPSEVVSAGAAPSRPPAIEFDTAEVARLTGLVLEDARIFEILTTLGFGIDGAGKRVRVTVPTWRPDVHGAHDLVEEVVRVHGLNHVPATPLPRREGVAEAVLTLTQKRARLARRTLGVRGFAEAVTYSFVPARHAAAFGAEPPVKLANPISSELDALRPSGLPSLVAAAQRNADRGLNDVALFEVGPSFQTGAPGGQRLVAAGIRRGDAVPRQWSSKARAVGVFDVKADALAVLDALGVPLSGAQIVAEAPAWYHPGRSGVVRLGPKVLAQFGELHPAVLSALDAKGPVAGFEIFFDALPEPKARTSRARPPLDASPFMPVARDFAFLVAETVLAADVLRAARSADKDLIEGVALFDVFAGEGVPAGQKSLAIGVTLQPRDKTLTDAEIDVVAKKIVAAVAKATGGTLRG